MVLSLESAMGSLLVHDAFAVVSLAGQFHEIFLVLLTEFSVLYNKIVKN